MIAGPIASGCEEAQVGAARVRQELCAAGDGRQVAAAALERISIPDDVRARISKYVWPGSSFIISDEELSKETGKNTDFVVVASNEPKGALKTRKRRKPRYYDDYYYDDYYYSYRRPGRRGYRIRRRRMPQNNSVFSWW